MDYAVRYTDLNKITTFYAMIRSEKRALYLGSTKSEAILTLNLHGFKFKSIHKIFRDTLDNKLYSYEFYIEKI